MPRASPVVAMDIPTGIDADTGGVMGTAIKADLTVTMAFLKRGLVLYPGAEYAGTVRVADLGMPSEVAEKENISVSLLDRGSVRGVISSRLSDAHKGDFGHLMIVAGSPGKAGAAIMAARGALRAGAGLVSVATPNNLVPIIQSQVAEAMAVPSAESIEGTLGIGAEEELLKAMGKMSASRDRSGAVNPLRDGPGRAEPYSTAHDPRGDRRRRVERACRFFGYS